MVYKLITVAKLQKNLYKPDLRRLQNELVFRNKITHKEWFMKKIEKQHH